MKACHNDNDNEEEKKKKKNKKKKSSISTVVITVGFLPSCLLAPHNFAALERSKNL